MIFDNQPAAHKRDTLNLRWKSSDLSIKSIQINGRDIFYNGSDTIDLSAEEEMPKVQIQMKTWGEVKDLGYVRGHIEQEIHSQAAFYFGGSALSQWKRKLYFKWTSGKAKLENILISSGYNVVLKTNLNNLKEGDTIDYYDYGPKPFDPMLHTQLQISNYGSGSWYPFSSTLFKLTIKAAKGNIVNTYIVRVKRVSSTVAIEEIILPGYTFSPSLYEINQKRIIIIEGPTPPDFENIHKNAFVIGGGGIPSIKNNSDLVVTATDGKTATYLILFYPTACAADEIETSIFDPWGKKRRFCYKTHDLGTAIFMDRDLGATSLGGTGYYYFNLKAYPMGSTLGTYVFPKIGDSFSDFLRLVYDPMLTADPCPDGFQIPTKEQMRPFLNHPVLIKDWSWEGFIDFRRLSGYPTFNFLKLFGGYHRVKTAGDNPISSIYSDLDDDEDDNEYLRQQFSDEANFAIKTNEYQGLNIRCFKIKN